MTPTMREVAYVTDTHPLIWYLTEDRRLSPRVAQIFESAERGETLINISSISIAEAYYGNQKNSWFSPFSDFYTEIKSSKAYRLHPFEAADVLDFPFSSAIPEMHDRIIVGLARRLNAPLLTRDSQIIAAGIVPIVW